MRRIAYAPTDRFKTDLSLRPIYHQKDNRSDAHPFFGLLAYWVVNTIRYELQQNGINCYWTEIVRRMSTQKLVTTEGIPPSATKSSYGNAAVPRNPPLRSTGRSTTKKFRSRK